MLPLPPRYDSCFRNGCPDGWVVAGTPKLAESPQHRKRTYEHAKQPSIRSFPDALLLFISWLLVCVRFFLSIVLGTRLLDWYSSKGSRHGRTENGGTLPMHNALSKTEELPN